ncbi:hypothetical protein AAFP32_14930 [Brevibacterium sp. CBA3109]|uniref:Uncharacterized protein n=1 Tax=Brevibacterium koreense TaxID=3140787 RepID=A0AAU7UL57_9MICO
MRTRREAPGVVQPVRAGLVAAEDFNVDGSMPDGNGVFTFSGIAGET